MTAVSRNQALMTAKRRGESLVTDGYHIRPGATPYAFVVERPAELVDVSRDRVSHYNVSLLRDNHTCDCAFFLAQGSHEKPCKHIVAVRLHVRAALHLLRAVADMSAVNENLGLEMER